MKLLFKRIRMTQIRTGQFNKYLVYAVGEIVLVVVGILIALQISNWNDDRKLRTVEVSILQGILYDLKADTIDLNENLAGYAAYCAYDDSLMETLHDRRAYADSTWRYAVSTAMADWFIVLHTSHFEELRIKGMSIISNPEIRDRITRLYDFQYPSLVLRENNFEQLNHFAYSSTALYPYLNFDEHGMTMSPENYERMLDDPAVKMGVGTSRRRKQWLKDIHYPPVLQEVTSLMDEIAREISRLEN